LGAKAVNRFSLAVTGALLLSFLGGIFSHLLYQRWNPTRPAPSAISIEEPSVTANGEPGRHRVSFVPLAPPLEQTPVELPVLAARDVAKIRALADRQARIRGRIFRVGHAAKSNTYFLNFGPSREALTAVIFNSAAELFEKSQQAPKSFENRDVEISGFIKDHPQYGLEVILEDPKQIKILN
jgi:hypothetical protein